MTLAALEDVLYCKSDGIARITINRPEVLNALRPQTYDELTECVQDASGDGTIGVLVLRGAGDRAFSSGGDVGNQQTRSSATARRLTNRLMELTSALRGSGKPVIAAVNGYAVGGGDEIHLMCDLTIASENAIFGEVGTRVGTPPVWGATQLLPRLIGDKRAREVIYLGRRYSAHEAYELGLVNKVVPLAELDAEVDKWCKEILARSPQALRISKTSINYESDALFASYNHGLEMLAMVTGTDEYLEGVNAFLEKRSPDYGPFRAVNES